MLMGTSIFTKLCKLLEVVTIWFLALNGSNKPWYCGIIKVSFRRFDAMDDKRDC